MGGIRLDQLVVSRGFTESREKAKRLVLAGRVRVDGQVQTKPGHSFPSESEIHVEEPDRFVGRGGDKLEAAFENFKLDVQGAVCADFGASTGGFTDCMLQHGAARVYAVDVGKGQLHWRLRNDPRVVVMEGVNARYLKPEDFPEAPIFITVDCSFISLTKILPAVKEVLADGGHIVSLIKPQFEAEREKVGKGGVIRDPVVREEIVYGLKSYGIEQLGLEWMGVRRSPIKGPAGNVEFLALWKKP